MDRNRSSHLCGVAVLLLVLSLFPGGAPAFGSGPSRFTDMVLESRRGSHAIRAELALDWNSWTRGLMGREVLAPATGMLFLYSVDRTPAIWMKNVPIPLDVLFLAADGTVVDVYPDRPPETTKSVSPRRAVRATLELPGGTAGGWGVRDGDRVTPTPETLGRKHRYQGTQ